MVRIAGLDPGMQKDSFALVIIETENNRIKVKAAYSWLGKSYLEVERKIAELHKTNPCDYYIVEQNNVGIHVIQSLRHNHDIPNIIPVTTAKDIKEPDKRPNTMDKNEMTRWILTQIEKGELVFPSLSTSKYISELKRQLSIFEEQRTSTGSVRYSAPSGEHDDLVMAMMLACWWAQKNMESAFVMINPHRISDNDKFRALNEENDQGLTGLRWMQK